jgi:hypothetical protein
VDTDPNRDFPPATQSVKCLVVRVLHPQGKPVFVRPAGGVKIDAAEQQYFSSSAAMTAVFGPVTSKDDLEAKLQGGKLELDLVSVERFSGPVRFRRTAS